MVTRRAVRGRGQPKAMGFRQKTGIAGGYMDPQGILGE